MNFFPLEAVKTNVIGTNNILTSAIKRVDVGMYETVKELVESMKKVEGDLDNVTSPERSQFATYKDGEDNFNELVLALIGSAKGMVKIADDFDEPLADFRLP